eukprot:SAG31_NODE_4660_length_3059_cov_2.381081_2_plen_213_part_00
MAVCSPLVCGESEIAVADTPAQCWSEQTWEDARSICTGSGARLCTVEELEADEAQGTGCNFDSQFVWTADDISCEPNQHVTVQVCDRQPNAEPPILCSDGYAASAIPPKCTDDSGSGAVRCCADTAVGTPCGFQVAENLCQMPGVSVTVGEEVDTLTNAPTGKGQRSFRRPMPDPGSMVRFRTDLVALALDFHQSSMYSTKFSSLKLHGHVG